VQRRQGRERPCERDRVAGDLLADVPAAADRRRHRHRAEHRRGGAPDQDVEQRRLVARAPRMLGRAPELGVRGGRAALEPGVDRPQVPGAALAELVAVRLEHREG
jgi:hypothetical protein